jgi:ferrochelatase
MSDRQRTGVLVMSYGTPESMDQIEAYYTHIRHGRPPSPEQLEDLKARYAAVVGGVFPLRDNTNKQVEALQRTLEDMYPDEGYLCFQGLKHAPPFIEDGVEHMYKAGIRRAVGVVLAPHYSVMSVGGYLQRAEAKAKSLGLGMAFVKSYHNHPLLIEAQAERVRNRLAEFSAGEEDILVLFSAHSLPAKILEMGDPYVDQLLETSRLVAERAGIRRWKFVWQSAGQTAVPWLGPDILDELRTIAAERIASAVLICPLGFVSEHLEVLYDIDIECVRLAGMLGLELKRTDMLGTDPRYMRLLAEVVHRAKEGAFHE